MSKRVMIILAAGIAVIVGAFLLLAYESKNTNEEIEEDFKEPVLKIKKQAVTKEVIIPDPVKDSFVVPQIISASDSVV